jgi:hypothetical protein
MTQATDPRPSDLQELELRLTHAHQWAADALRLARLAGQAETDIAYPAEAAARKALALVRKRQGR